MNENILSSNNINFVNSFKFKIPINTSIIDLKIRDIKFFSKILAKGKVAIYGNYQVLILYRLYLPNNNFKNVSICKKVNFYKILKFKNLLSHKNLSKIKIDLKLVKPPKCLYSIHGCTKTKCYFNLTNYCKLYMLSPLSISLAKKNGAEANLLDRQEIVLSRDLSCIKADKKRRYIDATTIIGNGSIDFFIEKNIDITATSDPLWIIDNVQIDVKIDKLILIGQKLIASGNVTVNITYKTLISSIDNASTGNLNYLQTFIPFSSEIKVKTHDNSKLKESDEFKVITAKCLGEKHNLHDTTVISSSEIVYNKITEQLIIQIKVIATRKEKLFI